MNREGIIYERNINTSYMKVPALLEENLDVRIMLQRNIKGMIPVERCYIDGEGQYWYDISGKQALDNFVKFHVLEYSIFEMLILRICEQLEILEWNLLDGNGLLMNPEFIFLNHKGDDITFVFYPQQNTNLSKELQKLMEYLLSKLDHTNRELVQGAYELYEIMLNETYQIQDLKKTILKRRMQEKTEESINMEVEVSRVAEKECVYGRDEHATEIKGMYLQEELQERLKEKLKEKKIGLLKRAKELLVRNPKEEIPTVIYPKEEEEKEELCSHPTICIASTLGEPRGVLMYEGVMDYPDFELDKMLCVIGKSHRAKLQIQRETISNFHAKIDYKDGYYYIEDMNSTNGTFVNEEIVNYRDKKILNAGDSIRFADVKYRFL